MRAQSLGGHQIQLKTIHLRITVEHLHKTTIKRLKSGIFVFGGEKERQAHK